MSTRRWLFSTAFLPFLVMGSCPLLGQSPTLTVTVTGTLGPVLSGTDPVGLNGRSVVLTINTSESVLPSKHNEHAVEYQLATSDVTATVSGVKFIAEIVPPKVAVLLTPQADIGVMEAVVAQLGIAGIQGTIYLKPGSWGRTVLEHMRAFSPSPQNITAATSPTGPGSKLSYSFEGTTVLGLTGTASSTN